MSDKSTNNLADKLTDKSIDNLNDNLTDKPTNNLTDKLTDKPTDKPIDDLSNNLLNKLSDNLFNSSSNKSTNDNLTDDQIVDLCKNFWVELAQIWTGAYMKFEAGESPIIGINECLGSLVKYISIEATFHQINMQQLECSKGLVELYITPMLDHKHIPIMRILYNKRVELPNLITCKYKGFYNNELFYSMTYGSDVTKYRGDIVTLHYDDIGCQTTVGYDKTSHKPLLNIMLVIDKKVAYNILKKKKITFKKDLNGNVTIDENKFLFKGMENSKMSDSREVWLPTQDQIDRVLLNIIGEYNYLNNVGYIELYPSDDPFILPDDKFTELSDLRSHMILINKMNHNTLCNYCDRNSLQAKLLSCSKCKKANYCSKLCQRSHWKIHKQLCNM